MKEEQIKDITIRLISKDEPVPYELLLDADPSKEIVDTYLQVSALYVALLHEKPIGEYVLCPVSAEVVEIKNIAVAEEHQGKGIGKLMLNHVFEEAKAQQYKTIIIGTGNMSFGPLCLYQKAGFELSGIKKDFFTDNYPEPLFENGVQVKHMLMLAKQLDI